MKQENFFKWLCAALLLLNATTLILVFVLPGKHASHHKRPDKLIKELGFDEKQEVAFIKLRQEHRRQMKLLDENEARWHKKMFENINDSARKNEYADSLGSNFAARELVTLYHFRQVRKLCTKEQIDKFDALVERMSQRVLHGPPKGSPPPGN